MNKRELHNGVEMPIIGLGTFRSKANDAYNAVQTALELGYRHIDTAAIYGNEAEVGQAIIDSGIPRSELFITTKVWNTDQGYEETRKAFEKSLQLLQLEYVDLYLIHWFKGYDKANETWRALEDIYFEQRAKAIGVSNFNIHHLEHLMAECRIKPMVNQVETHVYLQNHFLHQFCKDNQIQLEAYAPLLSHMIGDLLSDETMQEIADKHGKSIAQIAIKWLVERHIVVIPKSINPKRIKENISIFDFSLDEEDMKQIRGLNKARKIFPEFDNVDY